MHTIIDYNCSGFFFFFYTFCSTMVSFTILTLKWEQSSVNYCTEQTWMEVFSFKMIVSGSPDIPSKKLACLFVSVDMKMRKFMFICWYLLSRGCCSKYCLGLKNTRCRFQRKSSVCCSWWDPAQYHVKSSASGICFCPDVLFQFLKYLCHNGMAF